MSIISVLNQAIEQPDSVPGLTADQATDALLTIEYFPVAIGALKTLIKHPAHKEAKAHAERVIAHFERVSKTAAPEPDLSDLG